AARGGEARQGQPGELTTSASRLARCIYGVLAQRRDISYGRAGRGKEKGSMAQEAVVMEPKTVMPQRQARRRVPEGETQSDPAVRYFLAGKEVDGASPVLGRELASENEALIESLKTGVGFYAVSEYRATPDMTGKAPLIRKEAVRRTVTSGK
ncbi:MAG: hypothetical protein ACRD3O_10430, partial [Terriglobia bacterium]